MDLSKYQIPLGHLPHSAELILEKETIEFEFNDCTVSGEISNQELEDGIYKNKENSYFIKCTTQMNGVTPAMIDWWFGWFTPSTERYKLWHPKDHISSHIDEDISHKLSNKDKYIGIDSYVDEYIGKKLHSLCISFVEPSSYGFSEINENSTAICAGVRNMDSGIHGGNLLHHVVVNEQGSTMYSYFWLGMHPSHLNPLKDYLIKFFTKYKLVKAILLNDKIAKDLLIHCYEEMNHLSKILPDLYNNLEKK
jgi:hypothetical protein